MSILNHYSTDFSRSIFMLSNVFKNGVCFFFFFLGYGKMLADFPSSVLINDDYF